MRSVGFGRPVGALPTLAILFASVLVSISSVAGAPPAAASTISVSTTADVVDPNDGVTSLREAITAANANPGDDTVVLAAGASYAISLGCSGTATELANASGSLDVTDAAGTLTIAGNGASITGCPAGSPLQDAVFATAGASLALDHVVLHDAFQGVSIRNPVSGGGSPSPSIVFTDTTATRLGSGSPGGVIDRTMLWASYPGPSITFTRSSVDDNGGPVVRAYDRRGSLTITDSSVSRNAAGVADQSVGDVTILRSHLDGNGTSGGWSIGRFGGSLSVTDSTLNGNHGFVVFGAGPTSILRSHIDGTTAVSGLVPAIALAAECNGSPVAITDSSLSGSSGPAGQATAIVVECQYPYSGQTPPPSTSLTLTRSTISHNQTAIYVGALRTYTIDVVDSHLDDNGTTGIQATGSSVVVGGTTYPASVPITLRRSTVDRNGAQGGGGGITSDRGPLTVEDSSVSGNVRSSTCTSRCAGGISVWKGDLAVHGSTVASNTTAAANAVGGVGCFDAASACAFDTSTIAGNSATGTGGTGGAWSAGSPTVQWSTLADNSGSLTAELGAAGTLSIGASVVGRSSSSAAPECRSSSISSGGHNVGSDGSCGLTGPGDVPNAGDPKLGPLGANGGPTPTREPLSGSPVLDLVPAGVAGCPGVDQRGWPRPAGASCDTGAVEVSSAVVDGQVLDPDGHGVTGLQVSLVDPWWGVVVAGPVTTDASGAWSLRVPPGTYRLTVHDPSGTWSDRWSGDTTSFPTSSAFAVSAAGQHTEVLHLVRRGFDIGGTVHAVGGAPVSGVVVTVYDGVWGVPIGVSSTTAADGTYAVHVPPGTYRLGFHDPSGTWGDRFTGDVPTWLASSTVTAPDGGSATVDVTLHAPFASLSGRLTRTGGEPVAGVYVVVGGPYGNIVALGQSDADGRWSLPNVTPGRDIVAFYDPSFRHPLSFWDAQLAQSAATPLVLDGGDVSVLDQQLVDGGVITGRATSGGAPVSGLAVWLLDPTGAGVALVVTDAAGRFSFVVPSGTYEVLVVDPAMLRGDSAWSLRPVVVAGQDVIDLGVAAAVAAGERFGVSYASSVSTGDVPLVGVGCDPAVEHPGASLAGADLSARSLRGCDLTGADLSGANLTGTDLSGVALAGATLTGVVSDGTFGEPASLPAGWVLQGGHLVQV